MNEGSLKSSSVAGSKSKVKHEKYPAIKKKFESLMLEKNFEEMANPKVLSDMNENSEKVKKTQATVASLVTISDELTKIKPDQGSTCSDDRRQFVI